MSYTPWNYTPLLERIADALEKIAAALDKYTNVPTNDNSTEEKKCENCKYYEERTWIDPLAFIPKKETVRICHQFGETMRDDKKCCDFFKRRSRE